MANTATSVIQQRNSDMVELLKPDFVTRQELTYTATLSEYQTLPCLRYLGLGGLGSGGEWRDMSGNGMDLSYNGNPTMSYTTQGAPYWAYDGVGDYHSHVDDAHFDITGTETTVAAAVRGLTVGCWVYFTNAATAIERLLNKYLAAGDQRSWSLERTATGAALMRVSGDGSATVTATSIAVTTSATWYFFCGTFWPSTAINIWLNDTEATTAAAVPASIYSGSAIFEISGIASGALGLMTGRVAFPFVCACALSDAQITRLYNRSRGLFGV